MDRMDEGSMGNYSSQAPYTPPPPPPNYATHPGNQLWGFMKQERNSVIALISGALGSLLIMVSSILNWVDQEDYYSLLRDNNGESSAFFSAFLLIMGLAILVGVLIAYLWDERLAGGIFCIVISGAFCLAGFGFSIAEIGMKSSGESSTIGAGAYLGIIGGLFGLLSGLLWLAGRKKARD